LGEHARRLVAAPDRGTTRQLETAQGPARIPRGAAAERLGRAVKSVAERAGAQRVAPSKTDEQNPLGRDSRHVMEEERGARRRVEIATADDGGQFPFRRFVHHPRWGGKLAVGEYAQAENARAGLPR